MVKKKKKNSFGTLVSSPGNLNRTINIDRLEITLVYVRRASEKRGASSFTKRSRVSIQAVV